MARILVVDDEPRLREVVTMLLRGRGHDVVSVESGEAAVERYRASAPDLVLLDITLPGMTGVDTLERLRELDAGVLAVFLTASGTIQSAVKAIRAGGYDYLTKPFDNDDLVLAVDRALNWRRLNQRVRHLEESLTARVGAVGMVGTSAALEEVLRQLARVARSNTTVLLLGESGTGKELAARSLHRQSTRAQGPFIAVNCGAIMPTLAESELFGHERGAFTDARERHIGYFEQADGGTLLLDEVSELDLNIQVKLLRVLQEQEFQRVGGTATLSTDVRIVAATNRDLAADVAAGRFREDLYWRLTSFQLVLPPLRDRLGDLPLLANHLLDRIRGEMQCGDLVVSPEALELMGRYPWPGNIRELENALRHAAVMTEGIVIQPGDLPSAVTGAATPPPDGLKGRTEAAATVEPLAIAVARVVESTERELIERALEQFGGNKVATAAALGISRRTLYNRLGALRPDDADDPDD